MKHLFTTSIQVGNADFILVLPYRSRHITHEHDIVRVIGIGLLKTGCNRDPSVRNMHFTTTHIFADKFN